MVFKQLVLSDLLRPQTLMFFSAFAGLNLQYTTLLTGKRWTPGENSLSEAEYNRD